MGGLLLTSGRGKPLNVVTFLLLVGSASRGANNSPTGDVTPWASVADRKWPSRAT
jgi:hypothetical protein